MLSVATADVRRSTPRLRFKLSVVLHAPLFSGHPISMMGRPSAAPRPVVLQRRAIGSQPNCICTDCSTTSQTGMASTRPRSARCGH